jgi:hypothetical protein
MLLLFGGELSILRAMDSTVGGFLCQSMTFVESWRIFVLNFDRHFYF